MQVQAALKSLCEEPGLIRVARSTQMSVIKHNLFTASEATAKMSRVSLEMVVSSLKGHYLFRQMMWPELASLALTMRPMRFTTGEFVFEQVCVTCVRVCFLCGFFAFLFIGPQCSASQCIF